MWLPETCCQTASCRVAPENFTPKALTDSGRERWLAWLRLGISSSWRIAPMTGLFDCPLAHHTMNQMSSNVGPMIRRAHGMQAGASMERKPGACCGMAMPRRITKLRTWGRGLGIGSKKIANDDVIVVRYAHDLGSVIFVPIGAPSF
jgi:hypothetical protein